MRGKQADGRGGDGDGRGGGGGSGSRTEAKRQRRQEREKHAVVLDEIAPKETGRQAVLVRLIEHSGACGGDDVDIPPGAWRKHTRDSSWWCTTHSRRTLTMSTASKRDGSKDYSDDSILQTPPPVGKVHT